MQQTVLDAVEALPRAPDPTRLPVGRTGQLALLHDQLQRCDQVVQAARREAVSVMRDGEVEEGERWRAVQRLRTLAWKAVREILPLIDRVPSSLQGDPGFIECRRVGHVLRRTAEAALRDNANFTVDLVAAGQGVARRTQD